MATAKSATIPGDDINASVIDCGSFNIRVGPAGDDAPKAVLPTIVGLPSPPASKPRIAGDLVLLSPCAFPDIAPIYTHAPDGRASVADWDAMRAVWDAGAAHSGVDLKAAPLMIVEPARAWDDGARAKAMEIAFEACGAPAAYLGRGSAMAAFAAARTTACVVDVGHQGAVAVPVADGYELRKAVVESEVGGRWLSEDLYRFVQGEDDDVRTVIGSREAKVRAHHEVKRSRKMHEVAEEGGSEGRKYHVKDLSVLEPLKQFSDLHRAFYRMQVLHDAKASTFRVSPGGQQVRKADNGGGAGENGGGTEVAKKKEDVAMTDDGKENGSAADGVENAASDDCAAASPEAPKEKEATEREKARLREIEKSKEKERFPSLSTTYELPDGNIIDVSKRRAGDKSHLCDVLFENSDEDGRKRRAISSMVYDAITACDVDMRRELYGGIVLTGGTSLIPGTVERFTRELAILTPQLFKMKIIAAQSALERTGGPWIGGSIVASLGTFQQAWVSKAEFNELGSRGCLRKCP